MQDDALSRQRSQAGSIIGDCHLPRTHFLKALRCEMKLPQTKKKIKKKIREKSGGIIALHLSSPCMLLQLGRCHLNRGARVEEMCK